MKALFTAGLLLVLPVQAADEAREQALEQHRAQLLHKWEARFKAADADHDRLLTLDEAKNARLPGRLLKRFADIDTDRDGRLSPEELLAVQQARLNEQSMPEKP